MFIWTTKTIVWTARNPWDWQENQNQGMDYFLAIDVSGSAVSSSLQIELYSYSICCDNSACCFAWVDSLFFHCVGRMGIEGIWAQISGWDICICETLSMKQLEINYLLPTCLLFCLEDGGRRFHQSVGTYLPNYYTVLHFRWPQTWWCWWWLLWLCCCKQWQEQQRPQQWHNDVSEVTIMVVAAVLTVMDDLH